MPNILIIEAIRGVRNSLRERLEYEQFIVEAVENDPAAQIIMQKFSPDVVLCDCHLTVPPVCPFIVIAGGDPVVVGLEAARKGAHDFVPKPIDMNHLLASIRSALENTAAGSAAPPKIVEPLPSPQERAAKETREPDIVTPNKPPKKGGKSLHIVGASDKMRRVKSLIDRVAPSNARVLVTGNNGTGKEMVARALHHKSRRSGGPFVEINCAAIPSELIESELFGHEKGSFTSAVRQRKGKFEQANGGTLFMDEIGDMSPGAQAKVLRALQEGRICRVGSDKDIAVDVRVIAATNKNLRREIERGTFREDLYHRLSVIVINVPPLCERVDDIPRLVDHFLDDICADYAIPRKGICAEGLEALCAMPWPGNVRELRNVVERLVILGGDQISLQDVDEYVSEFVI